MRRAPPARTAPSHAARLVNIAISMGALWPIDPNARFAINLDYKKNRIHVSPARRGRRQKLIEICKRLFDRAGGKIQADARAQVDDDACKYVEQ